MTSITKLPPARWQDYRQLRIEAVKDSPQSFLSTLEETLAEKDEEWQQKIATMHFVETSDNKLVGMSGWYREEKQKLNHIANIVSVYVSPTFRGQGLGRKLVAASVEEAQSQPGVTKLQLGVITTQKNAYQLYHSLGFQKVGHQKQAIKVGARFYDEFLLEMILT